MRNYTEMHSALSSPSGATFASLNDAIAEFQLTVVNYWGDIQRDFIARSTTPVVKLASVSAPAPATGDGLDQTPSAPGSADLIDAADNGVAKEAAADIAPPNAASDAEAGLPEASIPRPGEALLAVDTVARAGNQDAGKNGPAVDEPVSRNAAMAILANPALASEAATRSSNDADVEEDVEDVRDHVADDIAAEIEREARQELDPLKT